MHHMPSGSRNAQIVKISRCRGGRGSPTVNSRWRRCFAISELDAAGLLGRDRFRDQAAR